MTDVALGRLEKIPLRDGWTNESLHFTPWLSQETNLTLLGETLGLSLEPEGEEVQVGPFRADLLAREVTDNRLVLIENQLERTDHGHLGQILTYAAGLQASYIIWVAASFTEEHRAALDWLNQATDSRFHFFGVEVELWRIGDSMPAPRFNIVSKPNEWARDVSKAARSVSSGERSEAGQLRYTYWMAFQKCLDQHPTPIKLAKVPYDSIVLFRVYGNVELKAYISKKGVGVYLRIAGDERYGTFDALQQHEAEFAKRFGRHLQWERECPRNTPSCTVSLSMKADIQNQKEWPQQHRFLADAVATFDSILTTYL